MIATSEDFEFRLEAKKEQHDVLRELGFSADGIAEMIPDESFEPRFTEAAEFCFGCGEKLTIPAIMWRGLHQSKKQTDSDLWLHKDCAAQLCHGLLQDLSRWDKTVNIAAEEV